MLSISVKNLDLFKDEVLKNLKNADKTFSQYMNTDVPIAAINLIMPDLGEFRRRTQEMFYEVLVRNYVALEQDLLEDLKRQIKKRRLLSRRVYREFESYIETKMVARKDDIKLERLEFWKKNPELGVVLEKQVNMISNVSTKKYNKLKNKLLVDLVDGQPLFDMGKKKRSLQKTVFSVLSEEKNLAESMRIARTESMRTSNYAQKLTYDETTLVRGYEWITVISPTTRHSHREVDGDIVEKGERFSNGLKYPLDPFGTPSEVVNCRCTAAPVLSEDFDVRRQSQMDLNQSRIIMTNIDELRIDGEGQFGIKGLVRDVENPIPFKKLKYKEFPNTPEGAVDAFKELQRNMFGMGQDMDFDDMSYVNTLFQNWMNHEDKIRGSFKGFEQIASWKAMQEAFKRSDVNFLNGMNKAYVNMMNASYGKRMTKWWEQIESMGWAALGGKDKALFGLTSPGDFGLNPVSMYLTKEQAEALGDNLWIEGLLQMGKHPQKEIGGLSVFAANDDFMEVMNIYKAARLRDPKFDPRRSRMTTLMMINWMDEDNGGFPSTRLSIGWNNNVNTQAYNLTAGSQLKGRRIGAWSYNENLLYVPNGKTDNFIDLTDIMNDADIAYEISANPRGIYGVLAEDAEEIQQIYKQYYRKIDDSDVWHWYFDEIQEILDEEGIDEEEWLFRQIPDDNIYKKEVKYVVGFEPDLESFQDYDVTSGKPMFEKRTLYRAFAPVNSQQTRFLPHMSSNATDAIQDLMAFDIEDLFEGHELLASDGRKADRTPFFTQFYSKKRRQLIEDIHTIFYEEMDDIATNDPFWRTVSGDDFYFVNDGEYHPLAYPRVDVETRYKMKLAWDELTDAQKRDKVNVKLRHLMGKDFKKAIFPNTELVSSRTNALSLLDQDINSTSFMKKFREKLNKALYDGDFDLPELVEGIGGDERYDNLLSAVLNPSDETTEWMRKNKVGVDYPDILQEKFGNISKEIMQEMMDEGGPQYMQQNLPRFLHEGVMKEHVVKRRIDWDNAVFLQDDVGSFTRNLGRDVWGRFEVDEAVILRNKIMDKMEKSGIIGELQELRAEDLVYHEMGHALDNTLTPQQKKDFTEAMLESYSVDWVNEMRVDELEEVWDTWETSRPPKSKQPKPDIFKLSGYQNANSVDPRRIVQQNFAMKAYLQADMIGDDPLAWWRYWVFEAKDNEWSWSAKTTVRDFQNSLRIQRTTAKEARMALFGDTFEDWIDELSELFDEDWDDFKSETPTPLKRRLTPEEYAKILMLEEVNDSIVLADLPDREKDVFFDNWNNSIRNQKTSGMPIFEPESYIHLDNGDMTMSAFVRNNEKFKDEVQEAMQKLSKDRADYLLELEVNLFAEDDWSGFPGGTNKRNHYHKEILGLVDKVEERTTSVAKNINSLLKEDSQRKINNFVGRMGHVRAEQMAELHTLYMGGNWDNLPDSVIKFFDDVYTQGSPVALGYEELLMGGEPLEDFVQVLLGEDEYERQVKSMFSSIELGEKEAGLFSKEITDYLLKSALDDVASVTQRMDMDEWMSEIQEHWDNFNSMIELYNNVTKNQAYNSEMVKDYLEEKGFSTRHWDILQEVASQGVEFDPKKLAERLLEEITEEGTEEETEE